MSMSAYSATLSDDVMASAKRAFERYDHDNSGTIQVEEICRALTEACGNASEQQVFEILDTLGLADGSSRVRFHEFLDLIDKTRQDMPKSATDGEEEVDAIKASFQWLGGDPENAESKVTKDKLQQVLRDFELNDDVDKVLGTESISDLSLQDLHQVFANQA